MIAPIVGVAPAQQSPLMVLALTILGEAENQSYAGKVGVGKTVTTRARLRGRTVADTVLAPMQYDCWDKAVAPQRVAFLEHTIAEAAANISPGVWEECVQAAESAMDPAVPDPTNGATHYCTILDAHGAPLWGCDDSGRKRPRWHSKQCIESGLTKELWRFEAHVFASTP